MVFLGFLKIVLEVIEHDSNAETLLYDSYSRAKYAIGNSVFGSLNLKIVSRYWLENEKSINV